MPSWVSNVNAIYRAGIVTATVYIRAGTTGNLTQNNFAPANFLPATVCVGAPSYGGNISDINRIISITMDKNGALGIWISEALLAAETIQFTYIVKNIAILSTCEQSY